MTIENLKVAIVQGGSWGDNINSTLMLSPIRLAFPESEIHIFTSNIYGNAFHNNKYIDRVIEHKCQNKNEAINLSIAVPPQIQNMGYSHIFSPHPMFNHDKWSSTKHPEWGENLIFAWVRALEDASIPYGSLHTLLYPTDQEIKKAQSFYQSTTCILRPKTLMEVFGESGQTFFDFNWLDKVVRFLVQHDHIIYISNKDRNNVINNLESQFPNNVFFAGGLSIRECAVLFNECDNFISVSSGLSNACNTDYCKKNIQWIEVVNSLTCSSAAIRKEGKHFWHVNDLNQFIDFLKTII
jgi:ADP-heptose:LPS heptosyltransferase